MPRRLAAERSSSMFVFLIKATRVSPSEVFSIPSGRKDFVKLADQCFIKHFQFFSFAGNNGSNGNNSAANSNSAGNPSSNNNPPSNSFAEMNEQMVWWWKLGLVIIIIFLCITFSTFLRNAVSLSCQEKTKQKTKRRILLFSFLNTHEYYIWLFFILYNHYNWCAKMLQKIQKNSCSSLEVFFQLAWITAITGKNLNSLCRVEFRVINVYCSRLNCGGK